jgi:hypothetical protein
MTFGRLVGFRCSAAEPSNASRLARWSKKSLAQAPRFLATPQYGEDEDLTCLQTMRPRAFIELRHGSRIERIESHVVLYAT